MKKLLKTTTAVLMMAVGCAAFAEDGRTIMQKVLDVKEPDYSHSLVKMDLIEKDGTTESRTVEEYGREKDGLESAVMCFLAPASVKNTRFLQVENKNGPDDKWIYLPTLKSTRRVNSSEGSKSFMGTDATYDDLTTRTIDQDTHELLKEETKNGYECWNIKSTPVDKGSSQYAYRITWIDKNTMLPIYTEMYDKKNTLVKKLTVEKIENIQGYNIPMGDLLENVQTGHSTRLTISKIEVNKNIPDRVFTQSFLDTGK